MLLMNLPTSLLTWWMAVLFEDKVAVAVFELLLLVVVFEGGGMGTRGIGWLGLRWKREREGHK
jgi:hypothetical protein